MIVKIPEQRQHPDGKNQQGFDDLINYIREKFRQGQEQQQPGYSDKELSALENYLTKKNNIQPAEPVGFADIITYASDASIPAHGDDADHGPDGITADKCLAIEIHGVTSIHTITAEMNAVAARNTRVKDPAYHFILSWPEHEKPAHEAIFAAARDSLKALNLQEHQYMLAIHGNTDNIHCHIAVNRVHPLTFKSQHLAYAIRTLHHAAREAEIKYGWTHDNGIYVVETDAQGVKSIVHNKDIDNGATSSRDASQSVHPWTDPDSLINWTRITVGPLLKTALPGLSSWTDLHKHLAQHGITLKDTGGGGMRITATEPNTGEILDIAASKALRFLKRDDLEKRWGAFTTAPESLTVKSPSRSNKNAKDFTDFDQFDRFGPHPETAFRRQRMQELRGINVDSDENRIEMLLPRDAQNHMEHTQADFDTSLRHGSAGRRVNAPQTQSTPKRDPNKRAERKAERAADRADLQRRHQEYRTALREADEPHQLRKQALIETHRAERQAQTQIFKVVSNAIRTNGKGAEDPETREKRALLAVHKLESRLQLQSQHRTQLQKLSLTRHAPLSWREWLLEQAQIGDQAALSALRGIAYQAGRDAKKAEKDNTQEAPQKPQQGSQNAQTTEDPDTQAYLALIARLLKEEKEDRAIRSADVLQARPYQCDALLRQVTNMTYRVTGNGNVEFYDLRNRHLFTDRGNRVTFDKKYVTDDELRLALLHAREKFGSKITLTGDDPVFSARMARMADDLGMTVINPELRTVIAQHRTDRATAAIPRTQPAPQPKTTTSQPMPTTPAKPITPEPIAPVPATRTPEHQTIAPHSSTVPEHINPAQPGTTAAPDPAATPTTLEKLREEILAIDPQATFTTINPKKTATHIGNITLILPDAFAQNVGRNTYALHLYVPPSTLPVSGKEVAHIKYKNGKPTHVPTPEKTKTRDDR